MLAIGAAFSLGTLYRMHKIVSIKIMMDTIFHLSEAHLKMRSPDVYLIFNRFIGYKWIDDQARLEATRMKRDTRKYLKTTFAALPALSMPFLILGGIYGGVFTPTEAAAVAAVASLFIG